MVRVLLITIDGVRTKDIFNGPDHSLIEKLRIKQKFYNRFGNKSVEELLPFLYNIIMPNSIVYTNMIVKNKINISYPGYNDILTGKYIKNNEYREKINKNKKIPNPNKTFIELLINKKKISKDKVVICTSWSNFINIFNYKRSKLKPYNWVNEKKFKILSKKNKIIYPHYKYKYINKKTLIKQDLHHDPHVYEFFRKEILIKKPNLMFLGLGMTDRFAHQNDYIEYWNHLILFDDILTNLIETLKSLKIYNDTKIIITTDHGRGNNYNTWTSHNKQIINSKHTWAIMHEYAIKPKIINKKIYNTFIFDKIMSYF